MLQGKLLSDEEVIKVVDKVLELIDTKEQFILDGFTGLSLKSIGSWNRRGPEGLNLLVVINLEVDEETVRGHLFKRARLDDNDDAIEYRFTQYQAVTHPHTFIYERKRPGRV